MKQIGKYKYALIFVALLVVGFLLRLPQLTASDFWYDEAFTAIVIRAPWAQMWAYLAADKVHPPLYYLLLRGWTDVLGHSLAAIRGYSLFFGMAIPPMVYAIVSQLHLEENVKKLFGLTMMAVFAISPFFVTYSVEARSYSFLAFLILVSLYFFIRMTRKLYTISWDTGFFLALLVAIALTHYLSILIVLGYVVAYALLVMIDKKIFYDTKLWTTIGGGLFFGWIGFTYAWHSLRLERIFEKANMGWIPQADLSTILRVLYVFLFGVDRQSLGLSQINEFSFPLMPNTISLLLLLGGVIMVVFAFQKARTNEASLRNLVILLPVGLIPLASIFLASSLGLHVYVDRYVIGYGTIVLLALGYATWLHVDSKMLKGVLFYALLLFFLVLPKPTTHYSQVYNTLLTYEGNGTVITDNPMAFVVLKSYFGQGKVKLIQQADGNFYNWALISHNEEIPESNLKAGNLVVLKTDSVRVIPTNWKLRQTVGIFNIWEIR